MEYKIGDHVQIRCLVKHIFLSLEKYQSYILIEPLGHKLRKLFYSYPDTFSIPKPGSLIDIYGVIKEIIEENNIVYFNIVLPDYDYVSLHLNDFEFEIVDPKRKRNIKLCDTYHVGDVVALEGYIDKLLIYSKNDRPNYYNLGVVKTKSNSTVMFTFYDPDRFKLDQKIQLQATIKNVNYKKEHETTYLVTLNDSLKSVETIKEKDIEYKLERISKK